MAYVKTPKGKEISTMGVKDLRKEYDVLANSQNRLLKLDDVYCHYCGQFLSKTHFYKSTVTKSGIFPICKECLTKRVCDYDKKNKIYTPNRTKVINQLREMDMPFIESLWNSFTTPKNEGEIITESAWGNMIRSLLTLPQYSDKKFINSDFGSEVMDSNGDIISEDEESERLIKDGRKRFGAYSVEDLYFLEREYEDWVSRYPCDVKAQEVLFQRVCFKQLEIDKAQKSGRDTKDLDKGLQDMLTSLGIKPIQNNDSALVDTMTFGQLIDKWENEKPIPEPEGEFMDVDHIGMLIDVFFKGHLAKMMGLKNAFSAIYEKFMAKYTVTKPQYEDGMDSETIFEKIFGREVDLEDLESNDSTE